MNLEKLCCLCYIKQIVSHSIALATEYRDLFFHANNNESSPELSAPVPRRIEPIMPEEAKYEFAEMLGKLLKGNGPQKHSPASAKLPKKPANPAHTPRIPRPQRHRTSHAKCFRSTTGSMSGGHHEIQECRKYRTLPAEN